MCLALPALMAGFHPVLSWPYRNLIKNIFLGTVSVTWQGHH